MRTILIIASALILTFAAIPQRVYAQAKATATVTATVIPSISLEIMKSNVVSAKEGTSLLTINLRGTENILVVVDSKTLKSANILQLTTDEPSQVILPSSSQAGRTSITYLSS
jgi:hypothetical protein